MALDTNGPTTKQEVEEILQKYGDIIYCFDCKGFRGEHPDGWCNDCGNGNYICLVEDKRPLYRETFQFEGCKNCGFKDNPCLA